MSLESELSWGMDFSSIIARKRHSLEKNRIEPSLLSQGLREHLESLGYSLHRPVGEGFLRTVWDGEYRSGALCKRVAIKIPHIGDPRSISVRILQSKGDPNIREVLALNGAEHPNLVEILDLVEFNGQVVTVEQFYDSVSLQDLAKLGGTLREHKFAEVFKQVIDGLYYLHHVKGLLHRDLKPSNILVGKDGVVKIADLQTAVPVRSQGTSTLPTRGGAQYAAPYILDAVLRKKTITANVDSDLYSLGATMYYSLTGRPLAEITMIEDPLGVPIEINGVAHRVGLLWGGKKIFELDQAKFYEVIRENLAELSSAQHKLIAYCTGQWKPRWEPKDSPPEYSTLKKLFRNATTSSWVDWEWIRDRAAILALTGGLSFGLTAGTCSIVIQEREAKKREKPVADMLMTSPFIDGKIDYLRAPERGLDELNQHYADIKARLPDILHFTNDIPDNPDWLVKRLCETNNVSHRLALSLTRSLMLASPEEKAELAKDERNPHSLAPYKFRQNTRFYRHVELGDEKKEAHDGFVTAIRYLRANAASVDSLADLYARYLCNQDELFAAQQQAGSCRYLPSTPGVEGGFDGAQPGYRPFIHPLKRKIIDRALAIYTVTEPDGTFHPEMIPEVTPSAPEPAPQVKLP